MYSFRYTNMLGSQATNTSRKTNLQDLPCGFETVARKDRLTLFRQQETREGLGIWSGVLHYSEPVLRPYGKRGRQRHILGRWVFL